MAINPYFSNFNYAPEQKLLEDIGIEFIQMNGVEVFYIKRAHIYIDKLFLEDPLSRFNDGKYIEMYLKNFMGFGHQSDMMSKFGMTMSDRLTMSVARRRFSEEFPEYSRPLEGDLVWFPMTRALFEIKYVEHEDNFYQHGTLQYFDIELERFVYSNETFDTGLSDIDRIEDKYSTAVRLEQQIETEDGYAITLETGEAILLTEGLVFGSKDIQLEDGEDLQFENGNVVAINKATPFNHTIQNDLFATESVEIIDFSEANPFGRF